jgi:MSHA pilin protein MshC
MDASNTARLRAGGFTFIELAVILILVGILAVTVLPRFSLLGGFEAQGFADQLRSLIRYGQKTAVAQRRNVAVTYTTDGAAICSYTGAATPCAAGCAGAADVAAIALPGGSFRVAGATTTMVGGTVCFDAVGRPHQGGTALAAPLSIGISDSGALAQAIVIEPETGYVR